MPLYGARQEDMEGHTCQSRVVVKTPNWNYNLLLQPSNGAEHPMVFSGIYIIHSITHRYLSWLRSISLFAIDLSPFCNLGLCRHETSFRQFHSRFFPDGRLFYSLTSLELEESVVCGQGEPEDSSDSHEEDFEW